MAGDVEAGNLLFHGEQFFGRQLFEPRRGDLVGAGGVVVAEQAELAAVAVALAGGGHLDGLVEDGEEL